MSSHKLALLVGVNEYADPGIDDLRFAASDAKSMAEALELPEFGFQTTVLVDAAATRQNVLRHLAELRRAGADLALFYFAGHGITTELGSFLVTYDAAPYEEGVELTRVVELLASTDGEQRDFVAIFDCCNSGAAQMPQSMPYKTTGITRDEVQTAFRHGPEASRAVLASCLADQLAGESPSLGHGIFTYYVLDGLYGAAADHTGRLTLSSLHEYVAAQLLIPVRARPVGVTPWRSIATPAELLSSALSASLY